MNDYYTLGKKQLETKLETTIKENDTNSLKEKIKEEEINEKYIYFSNKISDIIFSNINLYKEYIKSDDFTNLKNSDKIKKVMKKYIINIEHDALLAFAEKIKDFKFDKELEEVIISETKKNIDTFIKNFFNSKKAKALKIIEEIRQKFKNVFYSQEFHINVFEKTINEKMADFKIKEKETKKIYEQVTNFMLQKYKELLNKELENN